MSWNVSSFVLVTVALMNVALGMLTLQRSRDLDSATRFLNFNIALSLWVFGHAMAGMSRTQSDALFWTRAIMIGPVFVPYFLLQFIRSMTGVIPKYPSQDSAFHWIAITVFLFCVPSSLLIASISMRPWGLEYSAGPLYMAWSIYFSATMIWAMFRLTIEFRRSTGPKKRQLFYVLLGISVALMFGALFSLVLPLFGFGQLNRMGPVGTVGIIGCFSYAMVKHQLLDISIIIRRTLTYSLVIAVLACIYLVVITVCARLFEGVAGFQTMFSSGLSAALVSICFQPLRRRVQAFVDARFFRHYADREEKLYELSRDVVTHTSPEAMAQALMRVLMETLHPKTLALFLRAKSGSGFTLACSSSEFAHGTLDDDNVMVTYFSQRPQPFVQDSPDGEGGLRDTRVSRNANWRARG